MIFLMLYFISLLFLTNFQLGDWLRAVWARRRRAGRISSEEAGARTPRARPAETGQEASGGSRALRPGRRLAARARADRARPERPQTKPAAPKKPSAGAGQGTRAGGEAKSFPRARSRPPPRRRFSANRSPRQIGRRHQAADCKAGAGDKPAEPSREPKPTPPTFRPPAAAKAPNRLPRKPKPITVASTPIIGNYQLPPLDFLQQPDPTLKPTESKEELMANARLMQQTLAQFDIEVALGDITKGPTITRYELHPAPGVKLEKITALNNNIAAALKAERINILAPVPGKSSVGVEVPNAIKTKVIMRDLLESEEWRNTKARIPLALGKDVYGHPIVADLAEMPHLLIAGSTGSGKSVCINSIITSLLYRFSPDQLRFVMIDPEGRRAAAIQHPAAPGRARRHRPQESHPRPALGRQRDGETLPDLRPRRRAQHRLLQLAPQEQAAAPARTGTAAHGEKGKGRARRRRLRRRGGRGNRRAARGGHRHPRKAQLHRGHHRRTGRPDAGGAGRRRDGHRPHHPNGARGGHPLHRRHPAARAWTSSPASSRPTSPPASPSRSPPRWIRAPFSTPWAPTNCSARATCSTCRPARPKLIRAQGALITDQEIQSIVDFIAKQGKPSYEMEIHQQLSKPGSGFDDESGIDEDEEIIQQCIEVIRSEQKASVSLLQRRLRLGYGRAARIMDELENRGIVGPSKGAEPRDILIDLDGAGADGQGQGLQT